MNDIDLDRILDRDPLIAPSADFTTQVMAAVEREVPGRDAAGRQAFLAGPWPAIVTACAAVLVTLPFLPPVLTSIPDESSSALLLTLLGTALLVKWSTRPPHRI